MATNGTHPAYRGTTVTGGPISRFLLWCGGVDRDLLKTRTEAYRYTNAGVFVILVALTATVTFTIYASMILSGFSPFLIPAALFWGTIIFFLDRSILVEPSYGDLDRVAHIAAFPSDPGEPAPRPRPGAIRLQSAIRVSSMLLRVGIAIVVAYLVAESLVLFIFRPEIDQQLAALHDQEFRAVTQQYIVDSQSQVATAQKQLAANAAERDKAKQAVDDANKAYDDEIAGKGGTGKIGVGPAAAADLQLLQQAQQQEQTVTARTNAQDQTLTATVDAQQAKLKALQEGPDAAVKAIPSLAENRSRIYANQGWEEREKALSLFLAANRGNWSVQLVPWALRLLFFAIDLIPISLKLLNPWTLYGRRQREHAAEVRYGEREQHETQLRAIDLNAAIADRRAEIAHEVALSKEEWRRRWRIDHLDER